MKKYVPITALLLALLTFAGIFGVFAEVSDIPSDGTPSFDYSDADSLEHTELRPSELLALLSPDAEVSEAEAKYLDTYSNCFFLINDCFSNDSVSISFENGTLSVSAAEYSYSAENGTEVRWIPRRASLGENGTDLSKNSDGVYSGELSGVAVSDNAFVSVEYSCSLSIPASDANYILNYAYGKAAEAQELEESYADELGSYLESYRTYEEYLEQLEIYENELEAYENYLVLKKEYDDEYAAYQKYLNELEEYEADLAAYNKYTEDYKQYLADKAEYERIYAENSGSMQDYISYYEQLNRIRSSMYAIENIYTTPSSGYNSLFRALQNKELVSMFEKYKGELTSIYRIDPNTIDNLSKISDELNGLLLAYDTARSESEQAAFAFYSANYEEICYKFNYLYDSMSEIMTATIFHHICTKIEMIDYKDDPEMAKYKQWRITNVLSQIYLVCKCLDDTESASGSWEFYDYEGNPRTYYFSDLLSPNVIISDSNAASPAGLSWPTNVPTFTLPPVPVEPQKAANPLKPDEVKMPAAPAVCQKPVKPDEAEAPGEAPVKLIELVRAADIVSELENGTLTEREEFESDASITLSRTVTKAVSFENKPVLTVYDYGASSVISYSEVSSFEDISLPTQAPARDADRTRVYTFLGWSLSPNELIIPSESNVDLTKDICIYAVYSSEERYYTVSWITADGVIDAYCSYGEIPSFDGSTERESTETTVYTFDGWFPYPDIVTEDIVYTAQYTESERKYEVIWKTKQKSYTERYSFGDMPSAPDLSSAFVEGLSLFEFEKWDKTIESVNKNAEYTAIYAETVLVSGAENASLASSGTAYTVKVSDTSVNIGGLLALAASESKKIELDMNGTIVSIDQAAVSSLASGDAEVVSLTLDVSDDATGVCAIEITDANGSPVSSDGDVRIKIPTSRVKSENFVVYRMIEDSVKRETQYKLSDGYLTFSAASNSDFILQQLYKITFAEAKNGGVLSDTSALEAGGTVSAIFYPEIGYSLSEIEIYCKDTGELFKVSDLKTFKLPASDVVITAIFEKIRYTVEFVVNGEVVSSEKYEIGEMPTLPEITAEYEKDGYLYTFAGWSPTVSSVTGNATYTAKYNCFSVNENYKSNDSYNASSAFIWQTAVPLIISFVLVVGASVFFIVVFIRKRKKIKK